MVVVEWGWGGFGIGWGRLGGWGVWAVRWIVICSGYNLVVKFVKVRIVLLEQIL